MKRNELVVGRDYYVSAVKDWLTNPYYGDKFRLVDKRDWTRNSNYWSNSTRLYYLEDGSQLETRSVSKTSRSGCVLMVNKNGNHLPVMLKNIRGEYDEAAAKVTEYTQRQLRVQQEAAQKRHANRELVTEVDKIIENVYGVESRGYVNYGSYSECLIFSAEQALQLLAILDDLSGRVD